MPDLLLELFSEEIPARMQRRAAEDLKKLVTDALVGRGFLYEGAKAFATPRRLALHVAGLPPRGQDVREERRGPRIGAPDTAVQGFLKSAGLSSLDQAKIERDPKKGEFYVAVIERPGRPTPEVLGEILPALVRDFPWPKSMRWGAASREPGSLRWVRPLQSIVCTFGPETETAEVVPFAVDGVRAGDVTQGHRFMAPETIQVRRFDDYVRSLERARVVLDAERRKDIIRADAQGLAFARGLEVVEDEALLEEVAGLVEWPVALMGSFDESFLAIPPEVIRATIRANQKCFVLRQPSPPTVGDLPEGVERHALPSPLWGGPSRSEAEDRGGGASASIGQVGTDTPTRLGPRPSSPSPQGGGEGALANQFILVSNLDARDGGAAIVAGNERVVRARLSDAKFFWETDQKTRLEDRLEKLKTIVFHEKLGTQYERVERIAALARELAPVVGADPALAERAARLAKADLVTEMVGEFPELQGLMGRYYAAAQGEHPSVAAAVEEHYKPLGPSDRVPTDPVSVAVALADKIDTLVGFWAIDEKPTGSKDPYALRRAALGVVRLLLASGVRFRLLRIFCSAHRSYINQYVGITALYGKTDKGRYKFWPTYTQLDDPDPIRPEFYIHIPSVKAGDALSVFEKGIPIEQSEEEYPPFSTLDEIAAELLSFFADRLKVYLREQGARHDLIDAVFSLGAAQPVIPGEPKAREGDPGPLRSQSGSPSPPAASPPPAGDDRGMSSAAAGQGSSSSLVGEGRVGGDSASLPDAGAVTPTLPSPQGGGGQVGAQDDLLMIVRRVEALGKFLDTEDGQNLLTGYRRAANILRIEEKKDAKTYDAPPDLNLIAGRGQIEEKALAVALDQARREASEVVAREDFGAAMLALSRLRAPVDAFFDRVTVNTDDAALRENRLKLLNEIRRATLAVADFSKIGG